MPASTEWRASLIRLRHALHRNPELGLHLPRTQERILAALDGLGLETTTGTELSSVTAVLRGSRSGPAVLLRADMDALPLTERGDHSFISQTDGIMHACGHDLHMAMLVGAAQLLREATFPGSVIFMFQPGEEGHGGAELMVREGVLDAAGDRPIAAYALHVVASMLPNGLVVSRPGVVLGASDTMRLTVLGAGGHSAMPHAARSPIPAACTIVTAIQTAIAGAIDAFEPVVVAATGIHAGEADNAFPDNAVITLSIRSYSQAARARLQDEILRLARGIADAHGVKVQSQTDRGYPVTTNDPRETVFVATVVGEVFGQNRYIQSPRPLPASEDFAYILDEVPGAFVAMGACPADADPATAAPNHSADARYDDNVLVHGARLYAELALRRLHSQMSDRN